MKSSGVLLFTFIGIVIWGCSIKRNNPPGGYTDYERGADCYNREKLDSAFLLFNQYVNNADDTLKKGTAYRCMGDMQWAAGDLHGAEESATGAIRTLDPLNTTHHAELGYAYHLLGNVSVDLQHYDAAIARYNKAKSFSTHPNFLLELMNGEGVALQKKREFDKAVAVYDAMLSLKPADRSFFARILDNRTKTKWLQDPGYQALPEFWYALKIRVDSQYNRGLNASYAHLSDYYLKSNPDSALWYANKMFQQAQMIQSPADRLEAIDKLIRLDNSSASKHWYDEFKRLNDSLQLSRDTTRSRFALIKYDSQKSKADNLELKEHVTRQRIWLYGMVVFAAAIITWIWSWYDKRKKRIRREADNAIRESNLRISQKVHDVVANGLYVIMNELEHRNTIDREPLITKIEGLYEKSRNISYEGINSKDSVDYDKEIHDLLTAFSGDKTKVIVAGNQQTFWNRITWSQRHELQLILNEIMINMKKHSRAKNVSIVFKQEHNKGFIIYTDDGVGFRPDFEFGNGLNNTVNRIKSLDGEVNFGKSEKAAVSITLSFPLQSNQI